MTHHSIITDMAIDAPSCDCPACGGVCHPDDMMGDRFTDEMTIALLERYGRTVCFGCADEHSLCAICGRAVLDTNEHGECADCAGTLAREWRIDADHERIERAMMEI